MSKPVEGTFGSENLSSALLEPVYSESDIDYSLVYALFTFVGTMEGQISVLKGEPLELLDDSNSYWWAVKCLSTGEIGYIPAENIETPFEKLARLNRQRNVDVTTVQQRDVQQHGKKPKSTRIQFADYHTEIYPDGEGDAPQDEVVAEYEVQAELVKKKKTFLEKLFKPKSKPQLQPVTQPRASMINVPMVKGLVSPVEVVAAPINVLRIFPGNVTLNTTFKTVSFDKDTTIDTLIRHSLKKFRIPKADPSQFYMTVTPIDESGNPIQQERRLFADENINEVLDSYDVHSFLTESKDEGRNGSLSRIRQADGTIKFTVYQLTQEIQPGIRICIDDGVSQRWESINIVSGMYVSEVIAEARKRFSLGPELLRVYVSFTNKYIEDDCLILPMFLEAKKQGKELELTLYKDSSPPDNASIAQPPVRNSSTNQPSFDTLEDEKKKAKRKSTTFYKPDPIVTATFDKSLISKLTPQPRKNSSITEDALTHLQLSLFNFMNGSEKIDDEQAVLDYESMLNTLESSIKNRHADVSLYRVFEDIEKDIEGLLGVQLERASLSRQRSRLSQLYNAQKTDDIDAKRVFDGLKVTAAELNRLEGNLNMMIGMYLSKHGIPVK